MTEQRASSALHTPAVELRWEALGVVAGGRRVLDDVSLRAATHELVVLVGPNGAGKTTLLKTALALQRPAAGVVTIDGKDVLAMTSRERAGKLAWLPQHASIAESLAVREVVAVARYRFGESHARSLIAADRALARTGAAALAERPLGVLSGGERQRVVLASLVAQEAPLLLLDEPANHLDPAQQIEAYELIGALNAEGFGVVCVTHDVNLLPHAGKPSRIRVVGLRAGRIQFDSRLDAPDLDERLGALFGLRIVVARGMERLHFVVQGRNGARHTHEGTS